MEGLFPMELQTEVGRQHEPRGHFLFLARRRHRRGHRDAGLLSGTKPSRLLAEKRGLVAQPSVYAENVRALLDSTIAFEPVQPQDFHLALELQRQHGLLTNDSLSLAVARRLGLQSIATADANFDAVEGVIVYKPADLATA